MVSKQLHGAIATKTESLLEHVNPPKVVDPVTEYKVSIVGVSVWT